MQNTEELHQLWAEFLEKWPIERLREMKLEEYTNLKSNTDDYFCHWLERKTQSLGSIQGGSSSKFGIYLANTIKATLRKGLISDGQYVWWEYWGSTKEEAFAKVRKHILEVIESSQNGNHGGEMDQLLAPTVQMKIRFLYQAKPYAVLPMYSTAFVSKISERYLGESCNYKNLLPINLRLRKECFPHEDVIGAMYRMVEENEKAARSRRYWAGGIDWGGTPMQDEFIENNEWRMGWNEEGVKEKPHAQKFLDLFEEVEVGDYFAMKGYGGRNILKVHYIGEITEKEEEGRTLTLEPLDKIPLYHGEAPKVGPGGSWFGSLTQITNPEAIHRIFGVGEAPDLETEKNMSSSKELNQILYGPPGTGKTYRTIRTSVDLLDGSHDEKTVNQRFNQLKRQGRIEFLTFHQSYSYEDFVEGIRPEMSDKGGAQFTLKDGIFKRLATTAAFHCLEEIVEETPPPIDFESEWNKLCEEVEANPAKVFSVTGIEESYTLSISALGHICGTDNTSKEEFTCNKDRAARLESLAQSQIAYITEEDVEKTTGDSDNAKFVAFVVNLLHPVKRSIDPETASYAEMHETVQNYLRNGYASGFRQKHRNDCKPFVLIIDEINRGNISKILGELITLLEPDKRMGEDNELSVQLPYSQETFIVPANLHLIGTMNTADKSIALVDVALRRRFQFQELTPNFNLCKNLPDELQSVMEMINKRIMLRKDRDHRIGHAYFMDVNSEESFDAVMKRKIIPLLSEYFYNDWDGLRFVLGENEKDTGLIRPLSGESGIGRTRWQWYYDLGSENDLSPAQVLLNNFKPRTEAEGAE